MREEFPVLLWKQQRLRDEVARDLFDDSICSYVVETSIKFAIRRDEILKVNPYFLFHTMYRPQMPI